MAVLRGRLLAFLVLAAVLAAPGVAGAQAAATEYAVKAAFLYNFTKFVEWPDSAFPDGTLRLCVLGENPFGKTLQTVAGEEVAGHKLTVLSTEKLSDPAGCQVLFISQSERERMPRILADLRDLPVLTVSDTGGFIDHGGIINFTLERGKVRFEINQEAAERAGIKISSKLLRLATRVTPGTKPGP
jgi:hypothetical protein